MSVAAVCLNCNKALPASITASSTSQVIRCDGCGSLLLWAAGRVVRAIRQADKLTDSQPGTREAAPAVRDASTPPGRRPTPIERPLGQSAAATAIAPRQGGAPPIPRPAPPVRGAAGPTNAGLAAGRASMPTRAAVAAVAPSNARNNGFTVEDTIPGSPVATRGEAVDSGWHLGDDEVTASPGKSDPAIAAMVAASARSTLVSPPGAITAADRDALDSGWAAEASEGTPAPSVSPPPAPPALRLDNHAPPRRDRPMSFTPEPSVPGFKPSSLVPDSSPDWTAAARAALQLENGQGAVEDPAPQAVAPVAAVAASVDPASTADLPTPVPVASPRPAPEAISSPAVNPAPLVVAASTVAPTDAVIASAPEAVTAPVATAADPGDREATREASKAPEIEEPEVEATAIRAVAPMARPARGGRGGLVAAGVVGAVAIAIILFFALRGPEQTVADHATVANVVSAPGTPIPARSEKDEPEVAARGEHPAATAEAAVKVEAEAKLAAVKSEAAAKAAEAQAAAKAAAEERAEKARHAAEMKQQAAAANAEQARQAKADRITAVQRQREAAARARAEQAATAAQKKKEAQAARMATLQKRRQAKLQQAEAARATRAEKLAAVKQARAARFAAVRSAKSEKAAAAKAARADKLAAAKAARAEKLAAVKAANEQRAATKIARTERPARRKRGGHVKKKSALAKAAGKKAQPTENAAPIAAGVERKRPPRPEKIVLDYDKPKRVMRGKRGRRHPALAAASAPAPVAVVEPTPAPASATEPTPAEKEAQALDRARSVYREGSVKLFTGDFATAESAYQKSLMEFPGYVAAYRGLGLVYAKEDKAKEALDAWSTYLQLVPRAKDAWLVKRRMARVLRVHPELAAAAN